MNKKTLYITVHAVLWVIIFSAPLIYANQNEGINWIGFLCGSVVSVFLCAVFYLNYIKFVPNLLMKNKRKKFIVINIIIILFSAIILHFWMEYSHQFMHPNNMPQRMPPPPEFLFIFRDIFILFLSAGIASTLRLAEQWADYETARKETEIEKAEAELKNLRSQINPHFLLNTLNNIYALIAFDSDKAQTAVLELSKMLRHILYDNQQNFVNLSDEVQFINNYINLMRIRLQKNVEVKEKIEIPEQCSIQIAPLIFISLIENAFKHGISPTLPSFIHINIKADENSITCMIENSNNPKTPTDKSGHGIGLQQVEKRLKLSYPNKYTWTKSISEDNKKYSSKIIIYDTKMCNH